MDVHLWNADLSCFYKKVIVLSLEIYLKSPLINLSKYNVENILCVRFVRLISTRFNINKALLIMIMKRNSSKMYFLTF